MTHTMSDQDPMVARFLGRELRAIAHMLNAPSTDIYAEEDLAELYAKVAPLAAMDSVYRDVTMTVREWIVIRDLAAEDHNQDYQAIAGYLILALSANGWTE